MKICTNETMQRRGILSSSAVSPLPHIMSVRLLPSSQPTALPNRDDMSEEEGKLKHQESRIFRKIVVEGKEGCLARPSLILRAMSEDDECKTITHPSRAHCTLHLTLGKKNSGRKSSFWHRARLICHGGRASAGESALVKICNNRSSRSRITC